MPVEAFSLMFPEKVEENTGGFSFVFETITDTVVVPVLMLEIDKSVATASKVITELSSKFTLDCRLIAPIDERRFPQNLIIVTECVSYYN